ncbi:MAG TPA: hypothetical protein VHQ65_07315 [Thermoanaerobaculia bacterium]|nr:hypothetical protein [Thermoanaerobaculia bacterium]
MVKNADRRPRPARRGTAGHRALLVLLAFLPLWTLGFWRSASSAARTGAVNPAGWFERWEPLREPLRGVTRADLLPAPPPPEDPQLVFWAAQFALVPTVLERLYEPDQALRRAVQLDPHYLVVELPTQDELLSFANRLRDEAARHGRVVEIHDLGGGAGLITTRGGG